MIQQSPPKTRIPCLDWLWSPIYSGGPSSAGSTLVENANCDFLLQFSLGERDTIFMQHSEGIEWPDSMNVRHNICLPQLQSQDVCGAFH